MAKLIRLQPKRGGELVALLLQLGMGFQLVVGSGKALISISKHAVHEKGGE